MAKLGITMIEMYCKMVSEKFAPILAELKTRDQELKSQVEVAVKKDLGIYDLYEKKAKLQLQMDEIERQLMYWENKSRGPYGFLTPVEEKVKVVMDKSENGVKKEVNDAMNDMIYKIKLSGIDTDIKNVFNGLPGIVKKLGKKIDKLPSPNAKKLLK